MFIIDIILTLMAVYFVKQEYDNGRTPWLIAWSVLLGWDLHTLAKYL